MHGYFGQAIGTEAILQWEDDDLATLAQIADQTQSAVIRRKVREVVSWNAEHATPSTPLAMITRNDNSGRA